MDGMKQKNIDLDFFRECGRRGGESKSQKKSKAARRNLKRAMSKRWPRKETHDAD